MKVKLNAPITDALLRPYAEKLVAERYPEFAPDRQERLNQEHTAKAVADLKAAVIRHVYTLLGDTILAARLPEDTRKMAMSLRTDIRNSGEVEFQVESKQHATAVT